MNFSPFGCRTGVEKIVLAGSDRVVSSPATSESLLSTVGASANAAGGSSTVLIDLSADDIEFLAVAEEMQGSIREHVDGGQAGGIFARFETIANTVKYIIQSV